MTDQRATSPVVGKALEAAVLIAFLAVLTATLHAQVVPEYRVTAGDRVAERSLAAAADRLESAVPPPAWTASVETRVELPRTLAGEQYTVAAVDRVLVLSHPHPDIGARARLALPRRVVDISGTWRSDENALVHARTTHAGVVVRLSSGDELPTGDQHDHRIVPIEVSGP